MRLYFSAFALLCAAQAQGQPAYRSSAQIAYLVDLSSGTVLLEKNSKRSMAPASMTKMMTTYVVFDLIKQGKIDPAGKVQVNPESWRKWERVGSTMFLKPKQKVPISDLLHGVVTLSGNDAAIVLAEGVSGTEKEFVALMNQTAQRLGMKDTVFGTANGWPDRKRTVSTARDLAILAHRTITDFPELYRQYYGLRKYSWNGITQINRNPILQRVQGADGMKTGHTSEAGYCFTGTAARDGRRLILVVAGLPSAEERQKESIRLLEYGFKDWRSVQISRAGSKVASLPVQHGVEDRISVMTPRNFSLSLPVRTPPRYKLVVRYDRPVKAPVKKGSKLAKLVVVFDDGTIKETALVASSSVQKAGFWLRMWKDLKNWVGGA
jgi:serine-type D-Ala-D-Ala carboxypeptidase (penicillin-binding protein 5/6)